MRSRGEYPVINPALLSKLVSALVRPGRGGKAALAARLGLKPPYLSKLLSGRCRGIGAEKVEAIRRCLTGHDRAILLVYAIASPEAVQQVVLYWGWLNRELMSYGVKIAMPDLSGFAAGRASQEGLWSLSGDYPGPQILKARRWLRKRPRYERLFRELDERARRWGDTPEAELRVLLAECRALAPIVAKANRIERTAAELARDGDLEEYLKGALRAEIVLLDRPPALRRAQEGRRSRRWPHGRLPRQLTNGDRAADASAAR